MKRPSPTCPLTRRRVADLYYLEHRAKLLDLAAFLDRVDRAAADTDEEDFRVAQFRLALAILTDGKSERARRVLEHLSDPTSEPLESAAGMKGAAGAWPGAPAGEISS